MKKNAIYLSVVLLKGRLSYRRSIIPPSKENIQHFFFICALLDPDPDPQHYLQKNF